MPRIRIPWYQWRVSWKHAPWVLISAAGIWFSVRFIVCGPAFLGAVLLLITGSIFWGSSKTLWRNRQPFVFSVRGARKVRFRGGGRDETIFEEDGRQIRIYTELGDRKTGRLIYAHSILQYEPPHDREQLTAAQREEVLELLCEDCDYRGVNYEVVMNSKLTIQMTCPRCTSDQHLEVDLPFGCIAERHYGIGDRVEWRPNKSPDHGGRPLNGNLQKDVSVRCPDCGRDFWLTVNVIEDCIETVAVNTSQSVMIPHDSVPIIENGKVVGHRVEPVKTRR